VNNQLARLATPPPMSRHDLPYWLPAHLAASIFRRTTATLVAIAVFIPICDGLVILKHLGFAPPIYIHWGTALYMMTVAVFLRRPVQG